MPNLHSGEVATDGLVSMATIHFVNGVITTILVNANFNQDLFHRFNGHFICYVLFLCFTYTGFMKFTYIVSFNIFTRTLNSYEYDIH